MPRTCNEQMQDIVKKYISSGKPWPATTRDIAAWAIGNALWAPERAALMDRCAELLARAMREEYIIDPQGRTVRAKHAARIERDERQLTLWADIPTAPREHMELAFKQRRQQIVGDFRQLKIDVESFNDNRVPNNPVQMTFDFTYDLMELEAVGA